MAVQSYDSKAEDFKGSMGCMEKSRPCLKTQSTNQNNALQLRYGSIVLQLCTMILARRTYLCPLI